MRKKIIWIVLIAILVILLFVVTSLSFLKKSTPKDPPKQEHSGEIYPFPNKPNEHHQITEERCNGQKDEIAKEACFEELKYINALLENDVNLCKQLANNDKTNECIFNIARNVMDEKLCYDIEDNESEKERCIKEIAVDKLDEEICNYFIEKPFEKRECRDKVMAFDIIENNKDIKLCDNVRTLEYGPLCFKYMIHKIDYNCEQLEEDQKNLCISMVIKQSAESEEECRKIPIENYRKVCLNKVRTGKSDYEMDSDNDGKSDGGELFYDLDPFNPDSDGDSLKDGEELTEYHTDPSSFDTDRDDIGDYEEIFIYKTDPNNQDTDEDGYLDGEEVKNGYNPLGKGKLRQ